MARIGVFLRRIFGHLVPRVRASVHLKAWLDFGGRSREEDYPRLQEDSRPH